MKIATRNLLAELMIEALADPLAARVLACVAHLCRAGARAPTAIAVDQLLAAAPAPDREAIRAKLHAHPFFSWDFSNSAERASLTDAFLGEQQEITTRLARFSAALQHWVRDTSAAPRQQALQKGALLFNHQLFFEVHEILETQWVKETGEEKQFLQGLIQIAVAFHHLQNRNLRGAILLLEDGSEKIAPHQPAFLGVELREFLRQLAVCRAELLRAGDTKQVQFQEEKIPRLQLLDESLS